MNKGNIEEARKRFGAMIAEGAPVRTAARIVGVAASTGYDWARRQKGERLTPGAPTFARLVPSGSVAWIELEVGGVLVKVRGEFDQATLARVVATLKDAT